MEVEAKHSPVLMINAPEWFADPFFIAWLNNQQRPLMTWHPKGELPTEWSDAVVFVDPSLSGEGTDQCDMPSVYWDQIVALCRQHFKPYRGFHVVVRLTNMTE